MGRRGPKSLTTRPAVGRPPRLRGAWGLALEREARFGQALKRMGAQALDAFARINPAAERGLAACKQDALGHFNADAFDGFDVGSAGLVEVDGPGAG